MFFSLIDASYVRPGDVLICFDDSNLEKALRLTGSKYFHAAICISPSKIAESCASGVNIRRLDELIQMNDYVAVFRAHLGCWTSQRVAKLNTFIRNAIARDAGFNLDGMYGLMENELKHTCTTNQRLNQHFNGALQPEPTQRGDYFCSELVVTAFHDVGILDDSAAVFYNPKAQSPAKLAKDPTFGLLVGYIRYDNNVMVPEDDEFLHLTRYYEIYPDELFFSKLF